MTTAARFTPEHVETWRRDGVVQIQSFFSPDEVADVCADFEAVFGRTSGADEGLDRKGGQDTGRFHPAQFKDIQPVPIDCSPALNLIGVHPALITFAKAALRTEQPRRAAATAANAQPRLHRGRTQEPVSGDGRRLVRPPRGRGTLRG